MASEEVRLSVYVRRIPAIEVLRAWFIANPGEVLSYDDIALRFEVSRLAARRMVEKLRQEGTVQSATMVLLNPERAR